MGNQHDGARGQAAGLIDGRDPVVGVGLPPLGLFDNGRGLHLLGPTGLPVARLDAAEAGQDQNIGISEFHVRWVLSR